MNKPDVIAGKYEVLELIGRGGMGTVYKAYHRALERIVAIKMLAEELASDTEFRARFQQEALLVAKLNHPGIINIFDIEPHNGTFCIIMEFLDGESLQAKIDRDTTLPVSMVVDVGVQVSRALHHAHENAIIHRDVKPDNIFITSSGQVKVMDFGIARFADSKLKTQTGISMGTPKFMSPEQVTGKNMDAQTDLYSLGVCLYAALAGRVPFNGENPVEIATKHLYEQPQPISNFNQSVTPAVEKAVMRALEKSKALRYATGNEMADALEKALGEKVPIRIGAADNMLPRGATRRMPVASEFTERTPSGAIAVATAPTPAAVTPREVPPEISLFEPADQTPPVVEPKIIRSKPRRLKMFAAIGVAALLIAATAGYQLVQGRRAAVVGETRHDPAREFEAVQKSANEMLASGAASQARDLWAKFSAEHGSYRAEVVKAEIDSLTARLPLQKEYSEMLAERREQKGLTYLNKTGERPLALAYLEGARALKPEPYNPLYMRHISLLQQFLEKQRGSVAPADAESARKLSQEASAKGIADPLIKAITLDPWNFDLWLSLADLYQSKGYLDDARVLLNYVDRNTTAPDPIKKRASELLAQINR